jgi:hypothetical protein
MTRQSSPAKPAEDDLKQFSLELRRKKRLVGDYSVQEWLERLRYVAAHDSTGDRWRKRAGIGIILFGFASLFALAAPTAYLSGALFALFVGCTVLFFHLKSQDIPNRLRNSVLPLLTLLQQDADRKAPLVLNVDLSGQEQPSKQIDQQTLSSAYPKVEQAWFVDPWFQGSATLRDGSVLRWNITDRVRRRIISKLNARGKTKIKRKFKVKTRMDFSLSAKKGRYDLAPNAPSQPAKAHDSKWQLRNRHFTQGRVPDGQLELGEFFAGVSVLFKSLKPVEKHHVGQ